MFSREENPVGNANGVRKCMYLKIVGFKLNILVLYLSLSSPICELSEENC